MAPDNGAADRQADADTVWFCREKGAKQSIDIFRLDSDAGILNHDEYLTEPVLACSYKQFARATSGGIHRLNAVHHQIHYDLLQFDPIAKHLRQSGGKLHLQ
jgi:hypothetical protein